MKTIASITALSILCAVVLISAYENDGVDFFEEHVELQMPDVTLLQGVSDGMPTITPDMKTSKSLFLKDPRVVEIVSTVEAHLLELRKGCSLPDHNALNFPVLSVVQNLTSASPVFDLTFGSPLDPSIKAFTAVVIEHDSEYSVLRTRPRYFRMILTPH